MKSTYLVYLNNYQKIYNILSKKLKKDFTNMKRHANICLTKQIKVNLEIIDKEELVPWTLQNRIYNMLVVW